MEKEDVNYLIVVEDGNKLKGWINREDLEEVSQGTVADAMVADTGCAEVETRLSEALTLMLERDVANLPVVDEGKKLQGLLTFNDLQNLIGETYTKGGGKQPEVSQ